VTSLSDIIVWHQGDINKWPTSFYINIAAHNNLQNVFLLCSSLACTERTFWVSKTIKERSQSCALPYDIILWHHAMTSSLHHLKWPPRLLQSGIQLITSCKNVLLCAQVMAGTERTFWRMFSVNNFHAFSPSIKWSQFFQFKMSSNISFLA